MATAMSHPGNPWQNGAGENFNGKLRDECLSLERFRSRKEATVVIEAWQHYYNVCLHTGLGYLTLQEFKLHNHPILNRIDLQE